MCHRLLVATSGHLLQQQNELFDLGAFFCYIWAVDRQPFQLIIDFIQGVQQFPKFRGLLGLGPLTQTNLPEIFRLGQAAQGGVMFQLGLFFFGQSDFQPYFFIVRT